MKSTDNYTARPEESRFIGATKFRGSPPQMNSSKRRQIAEARLNDLIKQPKK